MSLSISTKSTLAPQYKAQFEEATKVFGAVQRISPSFISSARHAKWRADVALFAATANLALTLSHTAFSNSGTFVPCVKKSISGIQKIKN